MKGFFSVFFFKLLPKFSDFVNSDELYPVFIQENNLKQIKHRFFSSDKMRNSGNSATSVIQQFLSDAPSNK